MSLDNLDQVNLGQVSQELETFRRKIDEGKAEKTRAETNKENLVKQRDEAISQLRELGIDPDNAVAEIERMDKELFQGKNKIEELLKPPEDDPDVAGGSADSSSPGGSS